METPKTLQQAIENGIIEVKIGSSIPRSIENHVIDFIAQKFGVSFLEIDAWREGSSTMKTPEEIIKGTYERITGKRSKRWGR